MAADRAFALGKLERHACGRPRQCRNDAKASAGWEPERGSRWSSGERLTPELGDARLREPKGERAAGPGDDRRRARVAWIGAVSPSLLPLHRCRSGRASDRAPPDASTSSRAATRSAIPAATARAGKEGAARPGLSRRPGASARTDRDPRIRALARTGPPVYDSSGQESGVPTSELWPLRVLREQRSRPVLDADLTLAAAANAALALAALAPDRLVASGCRTGAASRRVFTALDGLH